MNRINAILQAYYGLKHPRIRSQQGGWTALAYQVTEGSQRYFLKVYEKSRASTAKWTALINHYVPILLWLHDHTDLQGKVPLPVLTADGDYQCEDEQAIYLLYAYIEGETIGQQKLTDEQVIALARLIATLHSYGREIPFNTEALQEDFCIPFAGPFKTLLNKQTHRIPHDVNELLYPFIESVLRSLHSIEQLAEELKRSNLHLALCHTDVHNWNLLQTAQQLILIDWEGLRLAPVEADLMFIENESYADLFFNVYRETHHDFTLNRQALYYYQIRRKLEDIWEFVEQLCFDEQEEKERAETLFMLQNELEALR